MDSALEMGQKSAVGSLQVFTGKILSTVILALGPIVIGLVISEGDYGLYAVAVVPLSAMLLFQDWGVGSAMTKYCAQGRRADSKDDLGRIIIAGLTFEATTGALLTLLSMLVANSVALAIGKPESASLMSLVSINIFFLSLFQASQSIFVGFERMKTFGFVAVIEASAQCLISISLVYLGYGAMGAILGLVVANAVAASISIALVYLIYRDLHSTAQNNSDFLQILKKLLRYGFPLGIATIISGLHSQFYSFMTAAYCDPTTLGNYKIATNFGILLTFFTIPISTVLFPTFSKIDPRREQKLLRTVFVSSTKYTAFFVVPVAMATMVLSTPLIGTLYANKWLYASPFLALYAIIFLFAATLGNFTVISLLSGLGKTKTLLKLNLLIICIGIPLAYLVIPKFGMIGAIVVATMDGLPSMFIGIYLVWNHFKMRADFQALGRILLSSSVAAGSAYVFLNVFDFASWLRLAGGSLIFLAMYFIFTPLTGAITLSDIDNLRHMLSSLGVLSKILEIPLRFMEALARAC
jgi:O-antigen/teichoic acid export membrane protein